MSSCFRLFVGGDDSATEASETALLLGVSLLLISVPKELRSVGGRKALGVVKLGRRAEGRAFPSRKERAFASCFQFYPTLI